jgi:hypothetical protein
MKIRFKKSLWIIVFILWSGLVSATSPSPSIQLPATDYDFGIVEEGITLSRDFIIKNTGLGVLEIADVRPG